MPDDLAAPVLADRLTALRTRAAAEPAPAGRGVNCHVHTNYSFASFASPCDAVWRARQAGVEIFGINDHYTIDGHAEFRAAAEAVGMPALFSLEIVAMDRDAAAAGTLLNDPGNPGRVYLCGKAVTTPENPAAAATLERLRAHQAARNQRMVAALDAHFRARLDAPGPGWDAVLDQTPHGNTTERHIARAGCERLAALAAEHGAETDALFATLTGEAPQGDPAAQQNQLRSLLLKAGKPCYVDEDPDAYPSVAEVHALFCQLGAVPTYPVLGNPVTDGEADIDALCARLADWGIHSLELIASRNTAERVAAVCDAAAARGWPVVDGTEHNTATMVPLLTELGTDPRFLPRLRDGACCLLGHQARIAAGESGYVDRDGVPVAGGYADCVAAGRALCG